MTGESGIAAEFPVAIGHDFYWQEHLDETVGATQIVVWFIEEAMSESCTDEDADEAVEEERVELLVRYLLALVEPSDDEVGEDEPHCPHQRVPLDAERTDGNGIEVGLPVDEQRFHILL